MKAGFLTVCATYFFTVFCTAHLLFFALLFQTPFAHAAHGYSMYGTLQLPAHFTHFPYANPLAPKGGTLVLPNTDRRTSFDKFNPFSMKGVSATGVDVLMFESLAVASNDEPSAMYGLLAQDIAVAADGLSTTFRLHPAARFNNGDAVTAQDVKYSFDTLNSKLAAPSYRTLFADVQEAQVLDARTIRFVFKNKSLELPIIVGGLPVFSQKWGVALDKPIASNTKTAFDKLTLQTPITSGPYAIEEFNANRGITYRRRADYWGNDIPTRKGLFNFERIIYKFYKDETARLEAFKAGEFDVSEEHVAKNWARLYKGRKFENGDIIKAEFKHHNGAGMQGAIMNTRKALFADKRVRQALTLALDFEWMNRQLFYGQYTRIYSYFNNSELAATGLPSADELALLAPLKSQLDPAVLGAAPLPFNTDAPHSLRENLRQARALLQAAGWEIKNGVLQNARGEIFRFEMFEDSPASSRVVAPWARNLEKLGIQLIERPMDFALLQKKYENFDFEVTSIRFPDSQSPGQELIDRFGSKAAQTVGSENLFGIQDAAVDALLAHLVQAKTRAQLVTAARALDRVLLHGYYVVPNWFLAMHRVAYYPRFGMPATLPRTYEAMDYVLSKWWEVKPR